jgi:PTS system nitrogen regulatory IIA component
MLLKLAEAARQLGVTEKEVLLWIRKDGLPATIIDGEYEVNRVDLLEWVTENGIAVPPDFLASAGADTTLLPSLRAALEAGGIHYDVPGGDKVTVLHNVVALLPIPPGVDPGFLLEVLFAREAMGTTAVGNGIAIPHVRHPILLHMATPAVTLCFLRRPIDFEAPDDKPVRILFTLTTPTVKSHLHLLSRLAYALRDPRFKEALERPGNAAGILAALD